MFIDVYTYLANSKENTAMILIIKIVLFVHLILYNNIICKLKKY